MATYQQQKQKVLQLFQEAITFAQAREQAKIKEQLEKARKEVEEGKLVVVVCGEFKQGKSCLLNALLEEPELFPVEVDIATNLVSTITYGEPEKITVFLGKPDKEEVKPIQRSEIPDYTTEQRNKRNVRQARLLVIETPNPKLKEGLVLADTPGIGNLNTEHADITYSFIPSAAAIIFVSDALEPLSAKELEFIKETILPYCQTLIFVVTKIDAVANYRAILESNRKKLAQVLRRPEGDIPIIPVSSLNKLDYLKSLEPEDLEDSNFEELERELWGLLSKERGQILLLHALSKVSQGIGKLNKLIEGEWEACQQRTKKDLEALERKYQEKQEQLKRLLEKNADWQKQLRQELQDIRKDLNFRLKEGFVDIESWKNKYLDDNRFLGNPPEIGDLLQEDILRLLLPMLAQKLSQKAADLHAKLEKSTGLSLNPFEVKPLELTKPKAPPKELPTKPAGLWEKIMKAGRSISFSVPIGATLGTAIGGAAGGAIGLIFGGVGAVPGAAIGASIGLALGGITAAKTGLDESLLQLKEKDKRHVSEAISPFVQKCKLRCQEVLDKAVTNLERFMGDELKERIEQEKNICDSALHSIQKSRNLSKQEAASKVAELQTLLQKLEGLQKRVKDLVQTIVTKGRGERGDWASE